MSDFHFYEPATGHGLAHDPFKAIVAPRPIGWISTHDLEGRFNLAPYSFFNAINDHPPMVMFSSSGWKDSVANVKATGEFVCNLSTRALAEQMNESSRAAPHGESEFELAKLTPIRGKIVSAPRVQESPAALECRLLDIIQLKDLDEKLSDRFLILGQVVGVHLDRAFLKDGLFDLLATHPIQRAGYIADYTEATTTFTMHRPK